MIIGDQKTCTCITWKRKHKRYPFCILPNTCLQSSLVTYYSVILIMFTFLLWIEIVEFNISIKQKILQISDINYLKILTKSTSKVVKFINYNKYHSDNNKTYLIFQIFPIDLLQNCIYFICYIIREYLLSQQNQSYSQMKSWW